MHTIRSILFLSPYTLCVDLLNGLIHRCRYTRPGVTNCVSLQGLLRRAIPLQTVFSVFLFFLFLVFPSTLWAVWPLSWELDGEKRFLGPLVSYDEEQGKKHLVVRPFLFSYDS